MVKSIVSMICVILIITAGAIYETDFINRQFNEFDVAVNVLYDKCEQHTAVYDDAVALQKNWLDKKKYLHIFIPHNEIKEMELWLAEPITLIKNKQWEDAISKLEVLRELTEQIPKTFSIQLENIL